MHSLFIQWVAIGISRLHEETRFSAGGELNRTLVSSHVDHPIYDICLGKQQDNK